MPKFHIVMPFSRPEMQEVIINLYSGKGVVLHPVMCSNDITSWPDKEWIEPLIVPPPREDRPHNPHAKYPHRKTKDTCYYKLNYFIQLYSIQDEDRFMFMCDDDSIEDNVIPELKKMKEDIVFISMKRGDRIPPRGMRHPCFTLYAEPKNIKIDHVGLQQYAVKGKILKEMIFGEYFSAADGEMATILQKFHKCAYRKDLFVLFNYFEKGRYDGLRPEISMVIVTRNHPERMPGVLQNIVDTADNPEGLEILIATYSGDPESHNFEHESLDIQTLIFQQPPGGAEWGNGAIRESSGRIIFGRTDNCLFRSNGWDTKIINIYNQFPDDIVFINANDLTFKDRLAIFPIYSRKHFDILGHWVDPRYEWHRTDDHIHHTYDILRRLGHDRIVYREDIVLEYLNVRMEGGAKISNHAGQATYPHDALLYHATFDDRKADAFKLAMHIDPTREQEYKQKLYTINDRNHFYVRTY